MFRKRIQIPLVYFLTILFFQTCVEPYDFESIGIRRALVVDASLSNEAREHEVSLSFTYDIEEKNDTPVSGASVWIINEENTRVLLDEKSPGHYVTDSLYAGHVNMTYKLRIELQDGSSFESASELLRAPVPIDSVYGRYITIPSDDDETNLTGVQIFVDAHYEDPQPLNIRYEYRESFEVKVPYPSNYDWSGTESDFEVFEREKPLGTCYRKYNSTRTILTSTFGLTENRVSEFPIKFIDQQEPDLAYAYIIGVRQYSISDEAYAYHVALREANESAGSFFDKQRGTFFGNISGVDGTEIDVLGFFEVAGAVEFKRVFNYLEFEEEGIITREWICTQTEGGGGCISFSEGRHQILFSREVERTDRFGETTVTTELYYDWSTVDATVNNPECGMEYRITDIPFPGNYAYTAHKWCSDCSEFGLVDRPKVWDD